MRAAFSVLPEASLGNSVKRAWKYREGGQVVTSGRFHARIVAFADALSVAGERLESFYSGVSIPAHL